VPAFLLRVLGLFAGPRTFSLQRDAILLAQKLLIVFELPLEAQVGAHRRPVLAYEGDGFAEGPVFVAHKVGDDESGRLIGSISTLEMPAAQWTRTLLFSSSLSMSSQTGVKYLAMFSDLMSSSEYTMCLIWLAGSYFTCYMPEAAVITLSPHGYPF